MECNHYSLELVVFILGLCLLVPVRIRNGNFSVANLAKFSFRCKDERHGIKFVLSKCLLCSHGQYFMTLSYGWLFPPAASELVLRPHVNKLSGNSYALMHLWSYELCVHLMRPEHESLSNSPIISLLRESFFHYQGQLMERKKVVKTSVDLVARLSSGSKDCS